MMGGWTWESCPVHPGKAGREQEVGSWPGAPRSPQLCATRVGCSASACVLQLQTAGVFIGNARSCTGTNPAAAQPGQPAPFGAHPRADPTPWVRRGVPWGTLQVLCPLSEGAAAGRWCGGHRSWAAAAHAHQPTSSST